MPSNSRATGPAGALLPTGEQFELQFGAQRAVVTEVGATLRSYHVGGREFLDTFAANEMSHGARGQVLMPWPNRIDGGAYEFEGQRCQLPLSEPRMNNASHGLVRWLNWTPRERSASRVTLALVLYPQSGYPFTLGLELAYELSDAGLSVRTIARNLGSGPLPFGVGFHPYFTVGTALVDEALLRLPARAALTTNARMIPTGRVPVAGGDLDFAVERALGATVLDTCFTDLIAGDDGWTAVTLSAPGGTPRLTLALDPAFGFVQAYTGDTQPAALRRRGIAIEPMTCPANTFNTGEGLRVLAPGQTFSATWRVNVTA